jgi:hypothetical protein
MRVSRVIRCDLIAPISVGSGTEEVPALFVQNPSVCDRPIEAIAFDCVRKPVCLNAIAARAAMPARGRRLVAAIVDRDELRVLQRK